MAVAILGIVTVVLARVAIQGMQIEGDAKRRLQASLLADRLLNEIEVGLLSGQAPRLGPSRVDEGPYQVEVSVTPLEPATLGLDALLVEPGADPRSAPRPGTSLLQPSRGDPALLTMQIQVRWQEGVHEREVTRTSFALDRAAAAPLLEGVASAAEAAAAEEAEGDRDRENEPEPEAEL